MKKIEKIKDEDIIEALENGIKFAEQNMSSTDPGTKKLFEDTALSAKKTLDTIHIIIDHNSRIRELIRLGYKEESIILTVTIFEVLMKDIFWKSKDDWFDYANQQYAELPENEKLKIRKKIQKYLNELKLFDVYLRSWYLRPVSSEIECLYEILQKNERKINFQNLDNKNGVRNTFLTFFDIDISKNLDLDQVKSLEKWNRMKLLFRDRHNIIHKGKKSSFTEDQILEVSGCTDLIIHEIARKKYIHVKSEWEKSVVFLKEKYGSNPK